jgi:hypothetical protein
MKTIVVLAISIVLVSILFCLMVTAAPSIPDDNQILRYQKNYQLFLVNGRGFLVTKSSF